MNVMRTAMNGWAIARTWSYLRSSAFIGGQFVFLDPQFKD